MLLPLLVILSLPCSEINDTEWHAEQGITRQRRLCAKRV